MAKARKKKKTGGTMSAAAQLQGRVITAEEERDTALEQVDAREIELTASASKLEEEQGFHAEEQRRNVTLTAEVKKLKESDFSMVPAPASTVRDVALFAIGAAAMFLVAFIWWGPSTPPRPLGAVNQGFSPDMLEAPKKPQTWNDPKYSIDPRHVPSSKISKDSAEILRLQLMIRSFEASGVSEDLIKQVKEELMRKVLNLPKPPG